MSGESSWRTIGIIGGLGPLACAHFYRTLTMRTGASADNGHPEVVLISDPAIPSRLGHLLRGTADPTPALRSVATRLESAGAELIVVPSVTTAAYLPAIARAVTVPVVDTLGSVAAAVAESGSQRLAIAATTGALQTGLLDAALRGAGIDPQYPDDGVQEVIQSVVESVKRGDLDHARIAFEQVTASGWTSGNPLLVGCTDLSPIVSEGEGGGGVLDVATVLADSTLASARR